MSRSLWEEVFQVVVQLVILVVDLLVFLEVVRVLEFVDPVTSIAEQ